MSAGFFVFDFTGLSYGAGQPVPVGGSFTVAREEHDKYKKRIIQQVMQLAMRDGSLLDNQIENKLVTLFAFRVEQQWRQYQEELAKQQGDTILAALLAEI